jgi:hypothetical protein
MERYRLPIARAWHRNFIARLLPMHKTAKNRVRLFVSCDNALCHMA